MPSSKLRTFASISGLILIIVLLHYLRWTAPIEHWLQRMISPGSEALYKISVRMGDRAEEFDNVDELKQAYKTTKNAWQRLLVQDAACQLERSENETLRVALAFLKKNAYRHIGADVIGKNIEPLGNTIVIDRGTNDGIRIGNPVTVGEGALVGKIMRAEPTLAIVELINDHQSKIGATLINQAKSLGLVEGGFGISIRMNFIPQNEAIHVGDTVITSGLEKDIPRGLVIGTVEAVEKEAYQPFQSAIVAPLYNLDKLSAVSVLLQQ